MNGHCKVKGVLCFWCRTDDDWRGRAGLPAECPDGITETNLPGVEVSRRPVVAYVKGCVGCREKARERAKLVR